MKVAASTEKVVCMYMRVCVCIYISDYTILYNDTTTFEVSCMTVTKHIISRLLLSTTVCKFPAEQRTTSDSSVRPAERQAERTRTTAL